ncbi:MAG TPA: PAS domain S-box protein [Candidatus Limnocylindrales bacterium]
MDVRYVSTFPSSDPAFRRVVERLRADRPSTSAEELTRRLRPLFPRVAIFEQQLTGEPARLYVFRDGRFEAGRADRWWESPDVACVCVDVGSGRLTDVSPEYAELMHAHKDDLVGRHFTEFIQPEARDAAAAMFESLVEDRDVTTQALVRRVDGTTVRIELHASREDGQIDVRYRPVR